MQTSTVRNVALIAALVIAGAMYGCGKKDDGAANAAQSKPTDTKPVAGAPSAGGAAHPAGA